MVEVHSPMPSLSDDTRVSLIVSSARPDVYPSTLKSVLMNSAAPLKDTQDTAQGKGMIDPPAALASLRALPSQRYEIEA